MNFYLYEIGILNIPSVLQCHVYYSFLFFRSTVTELQGSNLKQIYSLLPFNIPNVQDLVLLSKVWYDESHCGCG